MEQTFGAVLILGEHEVENADGVYAVQLEVPVATRGLLADGVCGIEDAAVLEELLVDVLHLDDELLAAVVLAVHVEDCTALTDVGPEVLAVEVVDVGDDLLALFRSSLFSSVPKSFLKPKSV